MRLSIVVIAGNEESMIESCLKLCGFADELVVVVDSASTDRTEKIAKRFTKRVFRRKLDSFAKQKNFAMRKARGDWILVVDADERVTPALAKEIIATIADPGEHAGFQIRREEFYFGRRMKHGGWSESDLRLTKRGAGKYEGDIHEKFRIKGSVGRLRETMWHFSNRSIGNLLGKIDHRTELHASRMQSEGHPHVSARNLFTVPAKEAWRRLVRKRGYKDGAPGVVQSLYHAFLYFLGYVKLWERQRKEPIDKTYARLEREASRKK